MYTKGIGVILSPAHRVHSTRLKTELDGTFLTKRIVKPKGNIRFDKFQQMWGWRERDKGWEEERDMPMVRTLAWDVGDKFNSLFCLDLEQRLKPGSPTSALATQMGVDGQRHAHASSPIKSSDFKQKWIFWHNSVFCKDVWKVFVPMWIANSNTAKVAVKWNCHPLASSS